MNPGLPASKSSPARAHRGALALMVCLAVFAAGVTGFATVSLLGISIPASVTDHQQK